ncbi:fatty-acid--CoA ligase [Sulfurospirillum sp. 1612]|uniref:fatty-acid--CoA ligase n=1 Tax=Sulfurospirillum sp. 1612 TaxID=3094835 RepID=UPI002F937C40
MGIKRYVLLSIIYLLAVGLYVYSFNGSNYALNIYTFSLNLPIAVWIVIPAIFLFLASIAHLTYYNIKDFFYKRAIKKDFDTFINVSKGSILGEKSNLKFKTDFFKIPGFVLSTLNYAKKCDVETLENEELKEYYYLVDKIRAGEIQDLKKYKISETNELFIANEKNKLKEDPKYAMTILKKCDSLDDELCKSAYYEVLKIASFAEIKKYPFAIDKDIFRKMMERYLDPEDDFEIDIDSIKQMLEQFNATSEDYLELAEEIRIKLSPDELIDLFGKLYNEKGQIAANAYLFTLYELQMIDKVREILEDSEEEDFLKFKTLLFLRDHGRNINTIKFLKV